MNLELSKDVKQYLKDIAYINEQVRLADIKTMSEIAKRLDLEITSQSFTQGTVRITADCNDNPST